MTSVTIVGLRGVQADKIKSIYGNQLDLRFADVDESPRQIKATAESSDYVVLMTKFVSHRVQDALADHDLTYCNGGVSSVKLKLDELLR
jgi:hypothetical protein